MLSYSSGDDSVKRENAAIRRSQRRIAAAPHVMIVVSSESWVQPNVNEEGRHAWKGVIVKPGDVGRLPRLSWIALGYVELAIISVSCFL